MQSLSEHELLALHEDVLTMQKRYGISYKDATHHLYLAEIAKAEVLSEACKAFGELHQAMDQEIMDIERIVDN